MNENYVPDDLILKNFTDYVDFESHSLVQFYHRNLAYFITFYILILIFLTLKKNANIRIPSLIIFCILITQVLLGIFTLISGLNIYLASGHQITSVLLVLSALNLYYSIIK